MNSLKIFRTLFACFFFLLLSGVVIANDTEAELPLGGLTFVQSRDISMDSEELFLSEKEVRVKYRFTNQSAKDITTLIAFPLPEIPAQSARDEESPIVNVDSLEFKTTVDGQPIMLGVEYVAKVRGQTINPRLKELGWSILSSNEFNKTIKKLTPEKLASLVSEGLITKSDFYGFQSNWSVTPNITRQQIFPAGKTITVEHRYVPVMGGSIAGGLSQQQVRAEYVRKYCIEPSFWAGFKKRQTERARASEEKSMERYSESWLGYVLKTGANWKGPIKEFRLVVDKGKTDTLVSFCMDGVKKISPTQFEVIKKNFVPDRDLDILLVN